MEYLQRSIEENLSKYFKERKIKIQYINIFKFIKDYFKSISGEKAVKTLAEEIQGVFKAIIDIEPSSETIFSKYFQIIIE